MRKRARVFESSDESEEESFPPTSDSDESEREEEPVLPQSEETPRYKIPKNPKKPNWTAEELENFWENLAPLKKFQ